MQKGIHDVKTKKGKTSADISGRGQADVLFLSPEWKRTEKLRKIHNDGMPKSCYNERIAKENRPPIGRGI